MLDKPNAIWYYERNKYVENRITQNLRTDPGYFYVFTFNAFHHGFRNIIASKQNTAVSDYAKRAKADKKLVQGVNRKFARLAERNAS